MHSKENMIYSVHSQQGIIGTTLLAARERGYVLEAALAL